MKRKQRPVKTVKVGKVLEIAAIVSEAFGVSAEDVLSKKRDLEIMKGRLCLYKILYVLGGTHKAIGKVLDRNHTTIMHGVSEFDSLYLHNDEFRVMADKAFKDLLRTVYIEVID